MKTKSLLLTTVSAVMLSVTAIAPAQAWFDIPLISDEEPVVNEGNIEFVTGGVGEDEREVIEASKGQYNVHVTQAAATGAFVEDTTTSLKRKDGKEYVEILNIKSGPLLYIQLEPGNYEISSVRGGVEKKQRFSITPKNKTRAISFGWKAPLVKDGAQ